MSVYKRISQSTQNEMAKIIYGFVKFCANADTLRSDCTKCQHGYDIGIESPEEDWHQFCGAGRCYLCEQTLGNHCEEFAEGDIPVGKERF